jgi:hypothetical protein
VRNLTALQTLDAVWRGVTGQWFEQKPASLFNRWILRAGKWSE